MNIWNGKKSFLCVYSQFSIVLQHIFCWTVRGSSRSMVSTALKGTINGPQLQPWTSLKLPFITNLNQQRSFTNKCTQLLADTSKQMCGVFGMLRLVLPVMWVISQIGQLYRFMVVTYITVFFLLEIVLQQGAHTHSGIPFKYQIYKSFLYLLWLSEPW